MELRQLRVFVAVAEELSFSRAADRLQVVQSAVSASVRKLEQEWDVPLFDRTTHSVRLTGEGRAMLHATRRLLTAAETVTDALDEVRGGLRGILRLGIMEAAGHAGLSVAEVIAAYRAAHPEVVIELRQGSSAAQADAVRDGELDLAIVALPGRRLAGLDRHVLADVPIAFACHRDHPLADARDVTFKRLAGESFAELPVGWGVRTANDRAFAAADADRKVAFEIDDVATVVDLVRHDLAVAMLPATMITPADEIVCVPVRGSVPRFVVSLVWAAEQTPSAAARAFIAAARQTAELSPSAQ